MPGSSVGFGEDWVGVFVGDLASAFNKCAVLCGDGVFAASTDVGGGSSAALCEDGVFGSVITSGFAGFPGFSSEVVGSEDPKLGRAVVSSVGTALPLIDFRFRLVSFCGGSEGVVVNSSDDFSLLFLQKYNKTS